MVLYLGEVEHLVAAGWPCSGTSGCCSSQSYAEEGTVYEHVCSFEALNLSSYLEVRIGGEVALQALVALVLDRRLGLQSLKLSHAINVFQFSFKIYMFYAMFLSQSCHLFTEELVDTGHGGRGDVTLAPPLLPTHKLQSRRCAARTWLHQSFH